jgi:hypothetical protein
MRKVPVVAISRYCTILHFEKLGKTKKNLSDDSQFPVLIGIRYAHSPITRNEYDMFYLHLNIVHCPRIISLLIKIKPHTLIRQYIYIYILYYIISNTFRLRSNHHQGDKKKGKRM